MTDSEKVRETDQCFLNKNEQNIVNALAMAIAQIDMSIHESGQSVNLAMEAFTETANCLAKVRESLDSCPDEVVGRVADDLNTATQQLDKAIVAFQFFDRLTQRITHIGENLSSVTSVVQEPELEHSYLWEQMQEKLRQVYSQDQERMLYRQLSDQKTGKVMPDDVKSNHEPTHGSTELF